MRIRPATTADAKGIAVIHVEASMAAYQGTLPDAILRSFTVERREAGWREMLQDTAVNVWLAEEEDRQLGWICIGRSRDPDVEAHGAEIWAMYVAPTSWRQGVGTALWSAAESFIISAGYSSITLWVLGENTRARNFYARLGFVEEPAQVRSRERGGVKVIELRMRRQIEP
jgi:ribosomal protein S18 acetylase RimI-like enzyme